MCVASLISQTCSCCPFLLNSSVPAQSFLRIRDVNLDGQLSNECTVVRDLGFDVGQAIVRKADKLKAVITGLSGNSVTINVEDGPISGLAQVAARSFRQGEWKILKTAPEPPLEVSDCRLHSALHSREMKIGHVRGKVFSVLLSLENKHKQVLSGIKMTIKPQRDVIATRVFQPGKLVLVPCTYKIEARGEPAAGSIPLGEIEGIKFQLAPCYQGPDKDGSLEQAYLQPFWSVRVTHEAAKANVELRPVLSYDENNDKINVPLLQNTKDIYVDDVLLQFVPKKEKRVSVEPLVPLPEPAKRRRTKGSG